VRRRTAGERSLASATSTDGTVVSGTRDALLIGGLRIPWEQIESADWDLDSSLLRVAEVGSWGEQRPVHDLLLTEPGRLLELIRERITASIVLQRHVPVNGRKGVFVIARRAPRGDSPIQWIYEYQEGVDPADPDVRRAAEAGLAAARDEVGLP
jgi:hypothetical protein